MSSAEDVPPPEWRPLQRGNDWGRDYLAFEPLVGGTADARRAISVVAGDHIAVRWADGTITLETVSMRVFSNEVRDMGRSYTASFTIPGFGTSIRGVLVWLPLDSPGLSYRENAFCISGGLPR